VERGYRVAITTNFIEPDPDESSVRRRLLLVLKMNSIVNIHHTRNIMRTFLVIGTRSNGTYFITYIYVILSIYAK